MFHNKLYKRYYPIKTEEQKNEFLGNHRTEMIRFLEGNSLDLRASYMDLESKYVSKLKKPVSFLGNVKYKNVLHNEKVALEMEMDKRLKDMEQELVGTEEKLYALKMSEEISIEDVNRILLIMDFTYRNAFMKIVSVVLMLALLLLAFTGCTTPSPMASEITSALAEGREEEEAMKNLPVFAFDEIDVRTSDQSAFYRDPVTDVIYVRFYARDGGFTWLADPDTGLPLKYDRFLEFYKDYIIEE